MKKFEGYKKGINLGGWLSQCGDRYNHEHYRSFITEADIEKIASWGLDHIRLPVDYNVIQNEDGSFIEEGFVYIDNCLEWCRKRDLRVVLDLHKAAGYVFDDANYCALFREKPLQDQFVALWEELARRYGKTAGVAFELLNEITARETAEIWNDLYERAIRAIRVIAPDIRIIVGGIFNSSIYGLTLLRKPLDENIVYTFHTYDPLVFTHQGAYWVDRLPRDFRIEYPVTVGECRRVSKQYCGDDFDDQFNGLPQDELLSVAYFEKLFSTAVEISEKFDVPLYCGEYGVIQLADKQSTLRWFTDINAALNKLDIPRAAWSYKEMDFDISGEPYAEILPELIKKF